MGNSYFFPESMNNDSEREERADSSDRPNTAVTLPPEPCLHGIDKDGSESRPGKLLDGSQIKRLHLNPRFEMFDCNLFEGDGMRSNLHPYYTVCKNSTDLLVTTCNFTAWRKGGRTNCTGKVIPAIVSGSEDVKVFFFDDNMHLNGGGMPGAPGICNLRDVQTGEFVEFSEGKNGFVRENAFQQTIIHSSTHYNNVIVQANILDAVANKDYFTRILRRYARPEERILLFTDVNATILLEDTIAGKGLSEVLISTMFALAEVHPPENSSFDFEWDSRHTLNVAKVITLKQLVRDLAKKEIDFYHKLTSADTAREILHKLISTAQVRWSPSGEVLTEELFWDMFDKYDAQMQDVETVSGIAVSWFECWNALRKRNDNSKAILASYGMDSRKIVLHTVPDENSVVQFAINFGMWGERDVKAYKECFEAHEVSAHTSAPA